MEISTLQPSDLVRLAPITFEKGKQLLPLEARNSGLFNVTPIPSNTGNTREFSDSIDTGQYARRKSEGEQASRARVKQGYKKIMYYGRIGLDMVITHEAMTLNKYPEIVRGLTSLGVHGANRIELDLQHRITFGTATSYTNMDGETVDVTIGDGLALFSAVHTLTGTSTTYRNRLSGDPQFSRGALENMERLINEETLNNFGEKVVGATFDILWYADDPTQENAILEFFRSTSSLDSGANAGVINVYGKKYRPVKLSRIATDKDGLVDSTKRKYWGVASSMLSQAHLGIWEEPYLLTPPSADNNGTERSTEDMMFSTRAAYGIAITSGAWIKGSFPAAYS
jgi:hypothetical protein